MKCEKSNRLTGKVEAVHQRVLEIIHAQRAAFIERNYSRLSELEKELELAVGEKGRIIDAFRQHQKEHGCQR
jgi:hypothetical protein